MTERNVADFLARVLACFPNLASASATIIGSLLAAAMNSAHDILVGINAVVGQISASGSRSSAATTLLPISSTNVQLGEPIL